MLRRFLPWMLSAIFVQGLVLILLGMIVPGFEIGGAGTIVVAAILTTLVQAIAWPFTYQIAARVHPLLFPIISFVVAGFLIVLLSDLFTIADVGRMHVDNLWTGVVVATGLTAGSTILGVLFSWRDDTGYDWFVIRPLLRRYGDTPPSDVPGVMFVEIDGLAEPILRKALAGGWMPTLQRWLDEGHHQITSWETDLSSQTSASQAGILLGNNAEIPAFRWFDKGLGELMVSSSMGTARALEQRLSTGNGLLREGASRWNVFSGDAPDALVTYSTFGSTDRVQSGSYLALFMNPYTLPRAIALYLADVVREWWQAWQQRRRDERPRVKRSLTYAFVRAATTTLMLEAGQFMLIADMFRGVPAVYSTFFAYDEVAHHSGIDREDAFKVLRTLDRMIATLEQAAAYAPRPYHLVILSDHGQSMGTTFLQRSGQTLGDLVTSLVDTKHRITVDERRTEDWGHLNVALSEVMREGRDQRTGRLVRRALRKHVTDERVELPPAGGAHDATVAGEARESDVVVLASGNMGLISFPRWPGRLSYEEIVDHFPALLPGLVRHPDIAFVMVRSEAEGGLVIGKGGIHYLSDGHTVGQDPLAAYGPNAPNHLRRTNDFSNAPDILVMGAYDAEKDDVAAFEELVGSHGGLGGPQTHPFILHPTVLDPGPEPIVGAAALYRVLRSWLPRGTRVREVEPGRAADRVPLAGRASVGHD